MPARAYPIHICGDVVSGISRLLNGNLIKAKAKAEEEVQILDFGFWILDFGFWILDFPILDWGLGSLNCSILGFGFWNVQFWNSDWGFWIEKSGFGYWLNKYLTFI